MFKQFTLCALLLVCASLPVRSQQLVQGQYIDELVDSFSYWSQGSCLPNMDFELYPDSVLRVPASGVKLVAAVTGLSGTCISGYGVVAVGDTLPFDTTHSYWFAFGTPGNISIEYRMVGTPTTSEEAYYCETGLGLTLAWCGNAAYLWALTSSPTCMVQLMNTISDPLGKGWELYPIPAHETMRLRHVDGQTNWESVDLIDLQGRTLRQWHTGEPLQVEGLVPGIYLLKIESSEGIAMKRFQIE